MSGWVVRFCGGGEPGGEDKAAGRGGHLHVVALADLLRVTTPSTKVSGTQTELGRATGCGPSPGKGQLGGAQKARCPGGRRKPARAGSLGDTAAPPGAVHIVGGGPFSTPLLPEDWFPKAGFGP